MGVTVSYKGETIASMNTGGTKTLKTAGKYCEGDITLGYVPDGSTLIPKAITENGVYNASSDNADGYNVVTVSVPEKSTLDEYLTNTLEIADISSATSIPDKFFEDKSSLINVIMPNVTSIGIRAFRNCTNLALPVLPDGITSIGKDAFSSCTKLSLTSLPNGITSINNGTFWNCNNLAITKLPSGVTSIGASAFTGCNGIPFLDFSDFTQIPTLAANAFSGPTFPFYFRDQQQLDEWAAATNWSTYANRFQIKPSGVI